MMLAYLRLELRRLSRSPRYVMFTVVMPVAFYLMFTGGAGAQRLEGVSAATAVMVSLACYGALTASMSIGPAVATERGIGWLDQLKVTPLPARQVVAAKVLTSMLLSLPALAAVFAAAAAAHGVHLGALRWAELIAVLWVGTIPFVLLGLSIGYLSTPQTVQPTMLAVMFSLSLLGGLWAPVSQFPAALRAVAHVLPTNRYAELGWSISAGHAPPLAAVAIFSAWTAGFAALAVLAYRRGSRTP